MTSTPPEAPEIFKYADFQPIVDAHAIYASNALDKAQSIFAKWYAENVRVGYCFKHVGGRWSTFSGVPIPRDTHTIHYFPPIPLAPAKVEETYCELGHKILGLVGIDDDTKNVLLEMVEKLSSGGDK